MYPSCELFIPLFEQFKSKGVAMSTDETLFLVLSVSAFVAFSAVLFWAERKTTSKN